MSLVKMVKIDRRFSRVSWAPRVLRTEEADLPGNSLDQPSYLHHLHRIERLMFILEVKSCTP
jgi:hypothetical protein